MKLEDARRLALSLLEVTEEPHHELSSFRIRGKIFATVPPSGVHLHVFIDEQQQALADGPGWLEPLTWGKKVVGVRVLLAKARRDDVRELLEAAWCRKAPKRLVKAFELTS